MASEVITISADELEYERAMSADVARQFQACQRAIKEVADYATSVCPEVAEQLSSARMNQRIAQILAMRH